MRPFVVYWNDVPAPYMVERFNAFADRESCEFEVWFNDRSVPGYSWDVDESSWHFRYRYLRTIRMLGRRIHWPVPLMGRRPDVLIMLYAAPVFVVGWGIARIRGVRTGFRVLKTFNTWVEPNRIRDVVKRFMFQSAAAIETPGEDGKRFAIECGARADRVFFATHTVNLEYFQEKSKLTREARQALRSKLNLVGVTFLYVGRLCKDKGLRYLLEAYAAVERQCPGEVSLILVGDGPDEVLLRNYCERARIRGVVFAGFQQRQELPRYFGIADAFVFPTLGDPYGIVVDEAMACSLPVISTSSAGEIYSRIVEGMNGYVVSPEDSGALADRMLDLALDARLRTGMGAVSAKIVARHTPAQWAEDFERIVQSVR